MKPIILDNDGGSDDLWVLALLLAQPERYDIKAITTISGNVSGQQAARNIIDFLHIFDRTDIPVAIGLDKPIKGPSMRQDGAFNEEGTGEAKLERHHQYQPVSTTANDILVKTLKNSLIPVTIFATGPLSNIAHLLHEHPELTPQIDRVIIMGGSLEPGPTPNPPDKKGNITQYAEFNFYQDPAAAQIVLDSLSADKTHLLTMDVNHQMPLNDQRAAEIRAIDPYFGDLMEQMMRGLVESYDRNNFGTDGPVPHDGNTVLYETYADSLYHAEQLALEITYSPEDEERHGEMNIVYGAQQPNATVIRGMHDPDVTFKHVINLMKCANHMRLLPALYPAPSLDL